jgi:pantoate kinase
LHRLPGSSQGENSRRVRLPPRQAVAFCPGAITNFFRIHYDVSRHPDAATGGGYILSRGTTTTATYNPEGNASVNTVVNGDRAYDAKTTRNAVELLVAGSGRGVGSLGLRQTVDTPIGSGFGASAASAVSAVYAVAAAIGSRAPKRRLALYAHRAEINQRTGLGTVSVVYNGTGAGAITKPGVPGAARFRSVSVPEDLRIVTAYLSPYEKLNALSSGKISERVNYLGKAALSSFLADPSLDTLAEEGEKFSRELGLESPEVKKLISTAKSNGAMWASQNMIGYAIHAISHVDSSEKVRSSLTRLYSQARVDVFEVGRKRAGLIG